VNFQHLAYKNVVGTRRDYVGRQYAN